MAYKGFDILKNLAPHGVRLLTFLFHLARLSLKGLYCPWLGLPLINPWLTTAADTPLATAHALYIPQSHLQTIV